MGPQHSECMMSDEMRFLNAAVQLPMNCSGMRLHFLKYTEEEQQHASKHWKTFELPGTCLALF